MDLRRDMQRVLGARVGDWPIQILQDIALRAQSVSPRRPKEEIARWFDTKPPFADWFNICWPAVTLLANAVKTELSAFVIPPRCYGVLRFFGNVVGNTSDYPAITFALEIDGAPLTGFDSILGPLSPALNSPIPMMDALLPTQRIRAVGSNSTASSVANVQAFLRGWFWAVEDPRAGEIPRRPAG